MTPQPNGDLLALLASVGGHVLADGEAWWPTDPDSQAERITKAVMHLQPDARLEFLRVWGSGSWSTALFLSDRHPSLAEITSWAMAQPGVLLLATPAGPPPPGVVALAAGAE